MQPGRCDQRFAKNYRPRSSSDHRRPQPRSNTKDTLYLLLVAGIDTQTRRLGLTHWYVEHPLDLDHANLSDVCGFFFCDPPNYQPPPDLDAFLRSGPPPVYIGFGSIVIEDPERLTAILLEAVRMAGVRAIISRGWSKLGGSSPSTRDVFYLGDCPHEWLFPRVVAVIHHGGAGTTACGLRYGRPTSIVPFFGE